MLFAWRFGDLDGKTVLLCSFALGLLSALFFAAEEIEAAIELKAYILNPRNDKTAYEFAEMAIESGNNELAQEILQSILHRNPTYKKAGILYEKIHKIEYKTYISHYVYSLPPHMRRHFFLSN